MDLGIFTNAQETEQTLVRQGDRCTAYGKTIEFASTLSTPKDFSRRPGAQYKPGNIDDPASIRGIAS